MNKILSETTKVCEEKEWHAGQSVTRRPSPGPDGGGRETFLRSRWADSRRRTAGRMTLRSHSRKTWLRPRTERRTDSGCSRETAIGIWKESEKSQEQTYFCLEQDWDPWRSRIFVSFLEVRSGMGWVWNSSIILWQSFSGFTHETSE